MKSKTSYISKNKLQGILFLIALLVISFRSYAQPAAPTATTATSIAATSFQANWTAVSGVSIYLLDVSLTSAFSSYVTGYHDLGVPGTNKSITGLTAGTTYYYRVRATQSGQNSGYSNIMTVTTAAVPIPPTANAATSITASSFAANWGSVSGVTGYRLDVSTVPGFTSFVGVYNDFSLTGLSQNITGLTAGNTYYYRVRAVNAFGASGNSSTITVLLIPAAPTASAATSITSTSFVANWSGTTGAASHRLDISTVNTFATFVTGYNNLTVSGTSQSVTGLLPATTYYYRVRAVNASGTSVNSSTITVLTVPAAPVASAATVITATSFTANWGSVTGATGYRLDVSTSNTFATFVSGYNNLTVAGTSQSVTGLTAGTTYYYRVRSASASGSSANSSTISVLLAPPPPSGLSATSITTSSFTLNWSASTGATGYQLTLSANASFTPAFGIYNNLAVAGTFSAITGLSAGTQYYCRVVAVNATGNSTPLTGGYYSLTVAPIATPATNITGSSFTANWNAVPGATSYVLDVSTSFNFSSFVSGYNALPVPSGTSQVVTVPMNVTYYYRVRAVDPSGQSANSNVITVDLDHNYIRKIDVQKTGKLTMADVENATISERITTFEFYDGLGRPNQTVIVNGSPTQNDLVQPMAYDEYDRTVKKYLLYADGVSGWFKENALFDPTTKVYQSGMQYQFYQIGGVLASDTCPFSKKVFEPNPIKSVLKLGSPGYAWQPDGVNAITSSDRTVKAGYEANVAGEVLRWTYTDPNGTYSFGLVNAGTSGSPIYYGANELYKIKTKDEHHNLVINYTNREGRTVLKRVQVTTGSPSTTDTNKDTNYASTYYIYNDLGNLVCVVPPEATRQISTAYLNQTDTNKDIFLRRWTFRYTYDKPGRVNQKSVPGAEPTYLVYDDRDRLVLTQDGNQRALATKEWTFTKYDAFNRPVQTGKYVDASGNNLANMQIVVNTYYNNLAASQAWFETYIGSGAGNVLGYDNRSFPQISATANYFTVTYYDIYDTFIAPTGYTYTTETLTDPETSCIQEAIANSRVLGLVTGTQVKNLSTGTWLRTVNYYDVKYRVIQTISDHQKGKLTISNVIDFSGKPSIVKRSYVVNGINASVKESFKYDHFGRPLWEKHSVNGSADIMIRKNVYNELGQLVDKSLHSVDNGTTFKQSVDFRYNIRGWLTKINEADVSTIAGGDAVNDYFGMELAYNTAIANLTSTPAFNGNISSVQWSKGNGGLIKKQAYSFGYDNLSRLQTASHYDQRLSDNTWLSDNGAYSENETYDMNGNILTLIRKGFNGVIMDNLTYTYSGNQLNYVNDSGDATVGYINGNTGTDDYSYDFNGNLDKDKNKGLSTKGNIKYNYLNLPEEITKSTNEKIKYIYDATGRKLTQEVYNASNVLVKSTDYIGELVYEGNVLKLIQHAEGRVIPDGAAWEYQYHLKDHLGNVRVTFTSKPQSNSGYATDFEAATNNNFLNYTNNTFDLVDHTDAAGTVFQKTQLLNGGVNGRIGLAKSLAVMPGDQITASVYTKYMNLGSTSNPNSFINSLAAAFGVSSGSTGDQLKIYSGLNSYAATVAGGDHVNDDEGAPKAFVTIIFFDKNYNLIDAAWEQVSTVGAQMSPTVKQPPHDLMSISAKAPEAGYAYIFLSNEHPNYVDVYFDDFNLVHTPSPIVAVNDYFPYGLLYNAAERENSLEQKYLYNSKELQDELSIAWYEYGMRMYMPDLARFNKIDRASGAFHSISPYSYGGDNPFCAVDINGDYIIFVNGLTQIFNHKMAGAPGEGYWGGMTVSLFKDFFNKSQNSDYTKFANGEAVPNETSAVSDPDQRYAAGYEWAKENYNEIIRQYEAEKETNPAATLNIVSHSQGAAFAEGIASYISEKSKGAYKVNTAVHLQPSSAALIKTSENTVDTRLAVYTSRDLVANKFGERMTNTQIEILEDKSIARNRIKHKIKINGESYNEIRYRGKYSYKTAHGLNWDRADILLNSIAVGLEGKQKPKLKLNYHKFKQDW